MSNRQHALRNIALKLNADGTAEVLSEQKLYKGSYGFIKLQVYAPKTQNTEAPVLSAYCTTVDELGREKISTHNYRLLYVGEFTLDGLGYLLFERYLPKEFTETVTQPNGLKITLNYNDSAPAKDEAGNVLLDDNGVPKRHATDLLVSSRYMTTVYPGGWNDESMELEINDSEAAQIADNMRNIADLKTELNAVKTTANNAMPKSGGTFTGAVKWNNEALQQKSDMDYFLGVADPPKEGAEGRTCYATAEQVRNVLGVDTAQAAAEKAQKAADAAQKTADSKYTKPSGGIPSDDLSSEVQALLDKLGTTVLPADILELLEGKADKAALDNFVTLDTEQVITEIGFGAGNSSGRI